MKQSILIMLSTIYWIYLGIWITFWQQIKIVTYQDIQNLSNKIQQKNIRFTEKHEAMRNKYLQQKCERTRESQWFFTVNPICLTSQKQSSIPKLSLQERSYWLWWDIKNFDQHYDLEGTEFLSKWSQPILTKIDSILWIKTQNNYLIIALMIMERYQYRVRVPVKDVAYHQTKNMSFYVSTRSTSWRSACVKHNFITALESLNNKIIKPGQSLNLNNQVKNLDYCIWKSTRPYLFYGWACGASTQLFRVSLMMPYLQVTQRHAHSIRYTQYYWQKVFGDDAAIYEMYKQFEVKNNGFHDILLKTFYNDNKVSLVGIQHTKNPPTVLIKKKQIWHNQGQIKKFIIDSAKTPILSQERTSSYKKN